MSFASSVHVVPGDLSGLAPMLGAGGVERLADVLLQRTLAVARAFSGDVVEGGRPSGRAMVVSADVPRLALTHLRVALLDLEEGSDVSFGATFDGGAYLIAMRDARDELVQMEADGLPRVLARAAEEGLEVGMLRMERRLRGVADAAALLADPLLPREIRNVLSGP